MIVVCPGCAAHYGIDREAFGLSARVVRCSACDHEWEAVPGEIEPGDVRPEGGWRAEASGESREDSGDESGIAGPSEAAEPEDGFSAAAGDGVPVSPESIAATLADEPERGQEKITAGDARRSDSLHSDVLGERSDELEFAPHEAVAFSEPENDSLPMGGTAAAEEPSLPAIGDGDQPAPSERRRRLIMAAGGGAALVFSLLILLAAAGPISHAWPGAAAVYSIFGLAPAPPGAGLDIRDVSSSREWTGSEDVLIVAGTVANVAPGARGLPPLRVTLFDADRSEVQAVVVQPAKGNLAEGESVPFVARIPSPAITARRVVVSFQLSPAEHG